MEEDLGNHKANLKFMFEWSGKEISTFEDAVEAVKLIEDGKFDQAFHQLFPTPNMFNSFDFMSVKKSKESKELCKKYQMDSNGGIVIRALHHHFCSPPDTSTVHFPSIEALITKAMSKRPSTELSLVDEVQDILRDGFTLNYIDPHEYAEQIAHSLTQNMDEYCRAGTKYVAPYTSLVTASMMGKTRLMKELTKYLPIVYMCFRETHETGYPPATENILSWFERGPAGRSTLIQSQAISLPIASISFRLSNTHYFCSSC